MAINIATFGAAAYQIGTPYPLAAHTALIGAHYVVDPALYRVTPNIGVGNPCPVTFTPAVAGDTVYLPYAQNFIYSVRLPVAGAPNVVTANLSGCRIYVDRIVGTNEVIMYHANSLAMGGGNNPLHQNIETGPLLTALDLMYTNARAYYTGAPHNLNLQGVATLGRNTYNNCVVHEVMRKQGQNRTQVDFFGATTVCGVFNGGQWQMHWQTHGIFTYMRPKNAPVGWVKGRDHTSPLNPPTVTRVLGFGQFL